jgi:hypothetical protein
MMVTKNFLLKPFRPKNAFFHIFLIIVVSVMICLALGSSTAEAQNTCAISASISGTYTITICLTAPDNGSTLTGNAVVSSTVAISPSNYPVKVQNVAYSLDPQPSGKPYLLTSYEGPNYTFVLPTTYWVDGVYTLSANVYMNDDLNDSQASTSISLTFSNGISSIPPNPGTFTPSLGTSPAPGAPFVVAAVGDGADDTPSALAVDNFIGTFNPNLFLFLGDVVEKGSIAEFYNWYNGPQANLLGRYRDITNATPGNHEYLSKYPIVNPPFDPPFYTYWNSNQLYYSYDTGGWHFINLNSNYLYVPTQSGSDQYQWLQQDLAAHPNPCTLVYYHHPLFNIGGQSPTTQMQDIWSLLAQNHVTMVLNGHDHDYQHWTPMDANGNPDPNGVTEFVDGTGGHGIMTFNATPDPHFDIRYVDPSKVLVSYDSSANPYPFGALRFELNPQGAEFVFMRTDGTILDQGVLPCYGTTDSQAPTIPSNVTATAQSATVVNVSWSESFDDTGVNGYQILRDGSQIGTVAAGHTSFTDDEADPNTPYSYTVAAVDLAGNISTESNLASVTTPPEPDLLVFTAEADAYTNAGSPSANFGSQHVLRLAGSPDQNGYIRFNVSGLGGLPVKGAQLKLYVNSSSKTGFSVAGVTDNSWGETTINFTNAPAIGSVLNSTGVTMANTWIALDVSPYVTGSGKFSFGLDTVSLSGLSFGSRETGENAPQLLVWTGTPPTATPTITQTSTKTSTPTKTKTPTKTTTNTRTLTPTKTATLSRTPTITKTPTKTRTQTPTRTGTIFTSTPTSTATKTNTPTITPTLIPNPVDDPTITPTPTPSQTSTATSTPTALAGTINLTPEADSYTNSYSADTNYGKTTSIRVDNASATLMNSYLRFDLTGYSIQAAKLKIYVSSSSTIGFQVNQVSDNSWSETAITYNNQPAIGSSIGASGAYTSGTWVTIDVTSWASSGGKVSFGLTTTSTTQLPLASRESANAPQLILTLAPPAPSGS